MTNSASFLYVLGNLRNLDKPYFMLLVYDSSVAVLGSLVVLITYTTTAVTSRPVHCILSFIGYATPNLIGQLSSCLIALLR